MKAQVAQVKIGVYSIEGLMLSAKPLQFAVSVPQLNDWISFSTSKNTASRDLQRLLGKGFSPSKVKIEGFKQLINCVLLEDVDRLLLELALEGNESAKAVARSLIGLSLTQVFADAFAQKLDASDRQQYLVSRLESVGIRKTFTDSVRDQYLATHPDAEKVPFYAYSNPSDALNRFLTGHPAKYWQEKLGVATEGQLRNLWGNKHLNRIKNVEELAQVKVDEEGLDPVTAIKEAIAAFHYIVWTEDELLGKHDKSTYFRNYRRKSRQLADV